MAKYRIKNYKGNLTESLSKFQKKYPGKKIVEAVEDEEELKITTEDEDENNENNTNVYFFEGERVKDGWTGYYQNIYFKTKEDFEKYAEKHGRGYKGHIRDFNNMKSTIKEQNITFPYGIVHHVQEDEPDNYYLIDNISEDKIKQDISKSLSSIPTELRDLEKRYKKNVEITKNFEKYGKDLLNKI